MIAVLGTYRGGSSAMAGVLNHLGVCMGHRIKRIPDHAKETVPYVCWEDWDIRKACRKCYTEPHLQPLRDYDARVAALHQYLSHRASQSMERPVVHDSRDTLAIPYRGCQCNPLGVKYPLLCLMGEEMLEAWGDVQFVSIERNPLFAAASAERWYGAAASNLIHTLVERRDAFLRTRPHVRVDYDQLVTHPYQTVRRVAVSLGLDTSEDRVRAAARSVRIPIGGAA